MFLTLDHVHNDGAVERKKFLSVKKQLVRTWTRDPRYQLLCWNCNLGKYHNNGVCPHAAKEHVALERHDEGTSTTPSRPRR